MKHIVLFSLLLTTIAAGETGGLQSMAYPPFSDTLRPNILPNPGFSGTTGWAVGTGQSYDQDVSHTQDGSGALRIGSVGAAETVTRQALPLPASGSHRIYRVKAWLKADGADTAEFRLYITDSTHGGVYSCGAYVSFKGMGGGWHEYTSDFGEDSCSYWHVSEVHANDTFSIELRARNVPSNGNIWVDDVTIEPVVRELVIFPTYPNYRGMLWPDQGTTMTWKAVVDPPEGYSIGELQVAVDLVTADGSSLVTSIESGPLAPVNTSGPWIAYSVTDMSYDASSLTDGVYYLRGRLVKAADQATLYTYPDYKIVKEPATAQRDNWAVWIDRYNRVVVKGTPTFTWGGFARFTGARNIFLPGVTIPSGNPDNYRALPNGCNGVPIGSSCNASLEAFTPWNRQFGLGGSTFLKQMADVKMNLVVAQALNSYNIGFDIAPPEGGKGTISSQGLVLAGSETALGTAVLAGDAIKVTDLPGSGGTITSTDYMVEGVGTHFLSDLSPGDEIVAPAGAARFVREIYSDTKLLVGGTSAPNWTDTTFTTNQYRRIRSLDAEAQTAILDQPFNPDLAPGTAFRLEKCAPGRNTQIRDYLGAFVTAAQDYNISYLHNWTNTLGVDSQYWSYAPYLARCHVVDRADGVEFFQRFAQWTGGSGLLGFHVSDEPSFAHRNQGIAHAFQVQQGAARASMGGVTEWGEGPIPRIAFDQWNNVLDLNAPDPYPATGDNLINSDDLAYGLSTWNKHGRSYNWPRRSLAAVFDSRPLWTDIQLWSWYGGPGVVTSTYPQASDMKIQIVSALAAGSTGIMWWQLGSGSRALGDRAEDDYLMYRRASKVVESLLPILAEPIQDLAGRQDGKNEYGALISSVSDPDIKCSSRRKDTKVLLACANTTNTDKAVTITLANAIPGAVVLPWDCSTIQPDGNSFTVTFKGLNGGTRTPGTGTITNTSGTTVTCTGCDFTAILAPRHTITAAGKTRLVLSVDSASQITIDQTVGTTWTGVPFTYSSDSEKENSAHLFLIDTELAAQKRQAAQAVQTAQK